LKARKLLKILKTAVESKKVLQNLKTGGYKHKNLPKNLKTSGGNQNSC